MPSYDSRATKLIAAVGPMTAAIKAQRTLTLAGISCEILSLLPSETRRSCAYGVAFSAQEERTVRAALRGAKINVSQYVMRGDG